MNPFELQLAYILPVDLGQQAVSLAGVTTRVSKPVLRLLAGMEHAVVGNLR